MDCIRRLGGIVLEIRMDCIGEIGWIVLGEKDGLCWNYIMDCIRGIEWI